MRHCAERQALVDQWLSTVSHLNDEETLHPDTAETGYARQVCAAAEQAVYRHTVDCGCLRRIEGER